MVAAACLDEAAEADAASVALVILKPSGYLQPVNSRLCLWKEELILVYDSTRLSRKFEWNMHGIQCEIARAARANTERSDLRHVDPETIVLDITIPFDLQRVRYVL